MEATGKIETLHGGRYIRVIPRQLTEQAKLGHQGPDLETTNRLPVLAHHAHDASAACRAPTVNELLAYLTAQGHLWHVEAIWSLTVRE